MAYTKTVFQVSNTLTNIQNGYQNQASSSIIDISDQDYIGISIEQKTKLSINGSDKKQSFGGLVMYLYSVDDNNNTMNVPFYPFNIDIRQVNDSDIFYFMLNNIKVFTINNLMIKLFNDNLKDINNNSLLQDAVISINKQTLT